MRPHLKSCWLKEGGGGGGDGGGAVGIGGGGSEGGGEGSSSAVGILINACGILEIRLLCVCKVYLRVRAGE